MTLSSRAFPRPSSSSSPARATPLTAGAAQRVLALPARHAPVLPAAPVRHRLPAHPPATAPVAVRAETAHLRATAGNPRSPATLPIAAGRAAGRGLRACRAARRPPAPTPATRCSLRMRATAVTGPCARSRAGLRLPKPATWASPGLPAPTSARSSASPALLSAC